MYQLQIQDLFFTATVCLTIAYHNYYAVNISMTNLTIKEDECDNGHTGVLCGACKKGLSLALGTSSLHKLLALASY